MKHDMGTFAGLGEAMNNTGELGYDGVLLHCISYLNYQKHSSNGTPLGSIERMGGSAISTAARITEAEVWRTELWQEAYKEALAIERDPDLILV